MLEVAAHLRLGLARHRGHLAERQALRVVQHEGVTPGLRHARQRLIDIALEVAALQDLLGRRHVGVGHEVLELEILIRLVEIEDLVAQRHHGLLGRRPGNVLLDGHAPGPLRSELPDVAQDLLPRELEEPPACIEIRGPPVELPRGAEDHAVDDVLNPEVPAREIPRGHVVSDLASGEIVERVEIRQHQIQGASPLALVRRGGRGLRLLATLLAAGRTLPQVLSTQERLVPRGLSPDLGERLTQSALGLGALLLRHERPARQVQD